MALLKDLLNDIVAGHRAVLAQDVADNITYDTGGVAPLLKRIHAAANQDKAVVLNKLVVGSSHVCGAVKHLLYKAGDLAEVQWRAVLFNGQVCIVADTLGFNIGRAGRTPLAQGVLANALGDCKPAAQDLLVAMLVVYGLELFEETVYHLALRY